MRSAGYLSSVVAAPVAAAGSGRVVLMFVESREWNGRRKAIRAWNEDDANAEHQTRRMSNTSFCATLGTVLITVRTPANT